MGEEVLLTIIIPVYNTGEYLDRCIQSVLKQQVTNYELIIIDDGSTDISPTICDYYACNCKNVRVIHTSNNGLSSARNLAISNAKGKYIGFLDSDDWIEPEMYKKLLEDAIMYDSDISACNMYRVTPDGVKTEKNEMTDFPEGDTLIFEGKEVVKNYYMLFSVCNKIFKRSLFENIKFPNGKIFEDARTMYRLASISSVATFNRYNGYNYYKRDNGITGTLTPESLLDKVLFWDELSESMVQLLPEEIKFIEHKKIKTILSILNDNLLDELKDKNILLILIEHLKRSCKNECLSCEEKLQIGRIIG